MGRRSAIALSVFGWVMVTVSMVTATYVLLTTSNFDVLVAPFTGQESYVWGVKSEFLLSLSVGVRELVRG